MRLATETDSIVEYESEDGISDDRETLHIGLADI
jgi:hypothetical protein